MGRFAMCRKKVYAFRCVCLSEPVPSGTGCFCRLKINYFRIFVKTISNQRFPLKTEKRLKCAMGKILDHPGYLARQVPCLEHDQPAADDGEMLNELGLLAR